MDLSNLQPAKGAVKNRKRIARGQGSGHGGTATRGHKGAKSRSGYKSKPGFEGGQMPLQRRVPKRGFKNFNRIEYKVFNLNAIQDLINKHNLSELTFDTFRENKLVSKNDRIKILGNGKIESKVDLKVHAISASAKNAIESVGGSVTLL